MGMAFWVARQMSGGFEEQGAMPSSDAGFWM